MYFFLIYWGNKLTLHLQNGRLNKSSNFAAVAYRIARLRPNGTIAVITDLVQVFNPLTVRIVRAAVAPHLSYNSDAPVSFWVLLFGIRIGDKAVNVLQSTFPKISFGCSLRSLTWPSWVKTPFRWCCVIFFLKYFTVKFCQNIWRNRGKRSCSERKRLSWPLALASFQNGGSENGAGKWSPATSLFPTVI